MADGRLLAGKTVLVTGGSGGIGAAVALAAAREGAAVGLGCFRSPEAAEAVAREATERHGITALALQFDASDPGAVAAAVARMVAATGRLDGLVLCAGVVLPGLLATASDEDIDHQLAVNLKGPIVATRAALPAMLAQRSGVIVTVSSVAAVCPSRGQSVYAATKGGLEAFTRAVAVEYARKGIRAHCIRPGPIATKMLDATRAQLGDALNRAVPLRRLGRPEDVAELAVFLLSDRAAFATGGVHTVDGGYSIAGPAGPSGGRSNG